MTAAPGHLTGEFWASLTDEQAAALAARGTVRTYARGQALLHEGQVPDRVLMLRSGRVKVYRTTPVGKEVVLAVRGAGELVGELAAIDQAPRSASIVAVDRVEALVVSSADFRSFLLDHPAAALVLLELVIRRLRDADAKRIEFASFTTIGRVALRIVELAERFGEADGEAINVALPFSQEELAGWTGSSLESVARALQTMRTLGWIETRRREIRVLDIEAIRRAAE
jgi:CRP/FNR family transcriptional regulator, cyclic AMP receptor protein